MSVTQYLAAIKRDDNTIARRSRIPGPRRPAEQVRRERQQQQRNRNNIGLGRSVVERIDARREVRINNRYGHLNNIERHELQERRRQALERRQLIYEQNIREARQQARN